MLAGSTGHSAVRSIVERQSSLRLHRLSVPGCHSCGEKRLRRQQLFVANASSDAGGSGRKADGSAANGGLDPALERAVPVDQRPVNELKALRQTTLYSWVHNAVHAAGAVLHVVQVHIECKSNGRTYFKTCYPYGQSSSLTGHTGDACLRQAAWLHLAGILFGHWRPHCLSDVRPCSPGRPL